MSASGRLFAGALLGVVGCGPSADPPAKTGGFAVWTMPNAAATTLPNPARLTVQGDVVQDEVTGLQWQRGWGPKQPLADAQSTCSSSAIASGGWRLPTRIELVSLLDDTRLPTVDAQAFPDTPADYFWSSSVLPHDPTFAFSVYFGQGEVAFGAVDKAGAHVRCVRGRVPSAGPQYDVSADAVLDRGTGLRWQRGHAGVDVSAALADEYCRGLRLQEGGGFRVPSAKELHTLIDERRSRPAIDVDAFPDTPARGFWTVSQSPDPGATIQQLVVFSDGTTAESERTEAHLVRCVR